MRISRTSQGRTQMKTINAKSFAILGTFALLATGITPARAEGQVPFKAQSDSAITFANPPYTATLVGKGLASHLGKTTTSGTLAIVGPAACVGGFAVEMHDVLTGPGGDQLFVTITMNACPVGENVYDGAGTWVVTGGTGRLAGATGGGTFSGLGDFGAGTVTCNLNGTISVAGQ